VTENESGLIYSGESGGLNEAMSDIFGAFTEAWVDGGRTGALAVSADTWKVGEDVLPPALRWMNDPAADGASLDYWTTGAGNVDVHYSSGIANLAFYLLSQGGTHPRGKSTIVVTGIGMDKAIRLFYAINVNILTSNSKYAQARSASMSAATDLGFTEAERNSVADAWSAVGVGAAPPPPADVVLTNGTTVTGLGGTLGTQRFFKIDVPAGQQSLVFRLNGGTGDADMYVGAVGTKPTLTTYICRPFLNGNTETCTITNPAAGTYYAMLNAYTAYSGTSLVATYTAGPAGDPILQNGVPVTGISGASGNTKFWKITPGAGRTLTVRISGGSGDADLYLRPGARPTTSNWSCRPYLNGNNEVCTVPSTAAGDYYIMLRAFSTYSGVTLVGSF
jgi:vibriolysin